MESSKIAPLLEPLQIALNLETEGRAFFLEAAAKSTGKFTRQTFEFLAGEEDRHIENISRFSQSIIESGGEPQFDVGLSDAPAKLASFNARLAALRGEFVPSMTDAEAYRFALQFENGAEAFYAEQMTAATHPLVRKFYAWLIDEESMHARLLTSCLQFAEDPESWFRRQS